MDEITPLVGKVQRNHWLRIKPSPWVLYPALLFLGCILGMLQGPTVQFIIDVTCERIDSAKVATRPREQCNSDPEVQASSSSLLMWIQVVSSLIGLVTTAVYSKMSDKRGRRPVMVINALGFIFDLIISWLVVRFKETAPLWLLLVGAAGQGLGGSSSTLLMACNAYCADCTSPTERTVVFGRLLAGFLIGSAFSPTFSGWIMEITGSFEPIVLLSLGAMTMWMLFALFVVPESHLKRNQPGASGNEESQPKESFLSKINFFAVLSIIFTAKPELANDAALPILAIIQLFAKMGTVGFINILVLYVTYVFAWTPADVGFLLSFENGAQLLGLLGVLPLVKKLHQTATAEEHDSLSARHSTIVLDIIICRTGLIFLALAMLVFSIGNAGWVMFVGAFLQIGGCLYIASVKSLMVQLAGEDNVGLILGAAAVIDSITYIASPVLSNMLYSRFVSTIPWIVFAAAGSLFAASTFLSLFIRARPLHHISL